MLPWSWSEVTEELGTRTRHDQWFHTCMVSVVFNQVHFMNYCIENLNHNCQKYFQILLKEKSATSINIGFC